MKEEIEDYLKIVKAVKSKSTYHSRKSALQKYTEWLNSNNYNIDEIGETEIKIYIGWLQDKVSDLTASQYITSISMFYAEMYEYNPVQDIKQDKYLDLSNTEHPKPTLKPNEIERLIESAQGQRSKALISLMASSGMRVKEAVNCRISRLNMDQRYIIINTVKTDYGDRKAYFSLSTRRHLTKLLSDPYRLEYDGSESDYIFLSGSNNQYETDPNISVATARRDFKTAVQNSNIDQKKKEISDGRERSNITTHILRRSFCQNWIDQNGDLLSLKNQVGWESIETAKSYIKEEATKSKRDKYGINI